MPYRVYWIRLSFGNLVLPLSSPPSFAVGDFLSPFRENCSKFSQFFRALYVSNPVSIYKKITIQHKLDGLISGILDSNQRPQRPERRALPAALIPVKKMKPSDNRKA